MRPMERGIAALVITLALAACAGSGTATIGPGDGTPAPGGGTPAPGRTSAGSAPCTDSTGTTTVAVGVANFEWQQPINAKVGDVITWTNGDTAPHKVALDDGSCAMTDNIPGGGSKSLVFSVAGSFPFHCAVHLIMKGTITIS
jgi:plastocyanin